MLCSKSINDVISAPSSTKSLIERVINIYVENEVWYLPIEVGSGEEAPTSQETLDLSVYNPRAWHSDYVPGN